MSRSDIMKRKCNALKSKSRLCWLANNIGQMFDFSIPWLLLMKREVMRSFSRHMGAGIRWDATWHITHSKFLIKECYDGVNRRGSKKKEKVVMATSQWVPKDTSVGKSNWLRREWWVWRSSSSILFQTLLEETLPCRWRKQVAQEDACGSLLAPL